MDKYGQIGKGYIDGNIYYIHMNRQVYRWIDYRYGYFVLEEKPEKACII